MDAVFLDTLVKLASLGASGICIFAIFWIGWLLRKPQEHTDAQHHKSLRYYMGTSVIIAIISATSGIANSKINAGINAELRRENDQITQQNMAITKNLGDLLDAREFQEFARQSRNARLSESIAELENLQESQANVMLGNDTG